MICCAQPPAPSPEQPSKRFLIIVDTSRAMEPRQRVMIKTVEELLKSSMGGQMAPGDTLGVWTYNANFYAGRFPLQRWSPAGQKAISSRLIAFLKGQKCELLPVLDNALPALGNVIRNSHNITVILVTAGDGAIQGTPFDHSINEFWQRWLEKQRQARMPFVVVLRGQEGALVDYSLNLPPQPVLLPPLRAANQIAAASSALPAAKPAPKPQPPAAEPLVISVKKAKALQPPKAEEPPSARSQSAALDTTNAPAPEPAKPLAAAEVSSVESKALNPNSPVATQDSRPKAQDSFPPKPPQPTNAAAPTAGVPGPESKVLSPPWQPRTQDGRPKPQDPFPPGPVAEKAKPEAVLSREPKVSSPSSQPATQDVRPKTQDSSSPAPPKAAEQPPAKPLAAQVAQTPLPPPPSTPASTPIEAPKIAFGPKPTFDPAAARPIAVTSAPPAQAAASIPQPLLTPTTTNPPAQPPRPVPSRAPPALPAVAAAPVATNTSASTASAAPRAAPPASAPQTVPPAQAATATPSQAFLTQTSTWVAGACLLATAGGFGWLAWRRARATPHASLITRSLDHGKKRRKERNPSK
ncbi:MAG TPA: hypothetical protein VMU04_03125 [Candidatus Acidoferrum sp.]|nr:hypothetical protein [Candidatus Acidoferrum sp.]